MGFANRLCGTGNRPLSHKENTRNRPLCSYKENTRNRPLCSDGSSYCGTLHFDFIDVFGLDETDIEEFGVLSGFRSWYILQHYDQYGGSNNPFNTVVGVDYYFEGSYGK